MNIPSDSEAGASSSSPGTASDSAMLIQIGRDQLELGSLPTKDAIELLRVGFLQPTDWYCPAGTSERRPLAQLALETQLTQAGEPSPSTSPSSWLNRARQSVSNVTGAVTTGVGGVAGRLKALASATPSAVSQAKNKLLEGYLPQIRQAVQKVLASRPIARIQAGARDDELMRKTFGAVYDCLPKPICRFVNEEDFIAFCLKHRTRLVGPEEPVPPPGESG